MCRLSWNLGASTSWNTQGLPRPVKGLLYLYLIHTAWWWLLCAAETGSCFGFATIKVFIDGLCPYYSSSIKFSLCWSSWSGVDTSRQKDGRTWRLEIGKYNQILAPPMLQPLFDTMVSHVKTKAPPVRRSTFATDGQALSH